jgi:small subunit ribosomal protein S9
MDKIVNTSGKRKTAIAKATIRSGTGRVRVNKKPIDIIEPAVVKDKMLEPLVVAKNFIDGVDIDVTVSGGGIIGQAEAVRTAIARGLVEWTEDSTLKEYLFRYDRSLLVNDSRQKEPKKFGGRGARDKRQKSYR